MKSRRKKIIQITISAILLFILLTYAMDYNQLKKALKNANYYFVTIALILPYLNRLLMPIKWNLLLRARKVCISWYNVVKIYYISSFLGLFLPPTIGSDVVRAYYISKKKRQFPDIISSIVVERFMGLIALLLFGLAGGVIFLIYCSNSTFDLSKFLSMTILSAVIIIGGFLLSLSGWLSRFILRFNESFARKKLVGKFADLLLKIYQCYIQYKTKKKTLFLFFLLTCLEIALRALRSYIIALALSINLSMFYFFVFIPIILLLIRLPISLSGFGIHEGGFVYFLSLMGVSKTLGFSIGIIDHFILIYAVLPGGIFYALERNQIQLKEEIDRTMNTQYRNISKSAESGNDLYR